MQYFDANRLIAVIQQDRKNFTPALRRLVISDLNALLSSYFESLTGIKFQVAEEKDGYTLMISAKAKRIAPIRALT